MSFLPNKNLLSIRPITASELTRITLSAIAIIGYGSSRNERNEPLTCCLLRRPPRGEGEEVEALLWKALVITTCLKYPPARPGLQWEVRCLVVQARGRNPPLSGNLFNWTDMLRMEEEKKLSSLGKGVGISNAPAPSSGLERAPRRIRVLVGRVARSSSRVKLRLY